MNLDLHLTTSCNMKCSFCGAWEQDISNYTISLEDAVHTLEEGKKFGYKFLTLTGGEPLLHKNIKEIITYASQLGYWICVTTNGLKIDDDLIETLKCTRCQLRISLHTTDRNFHKEITQTDTWDIVLANMKKLADNAILFGIGMTVYEDNLQEIPNLAELAWRQGASFIRFTPVVGIRGGEGLKSDEDFYFRMLTSICTCALDNYHLLNYRLNRSLQGKQMLDFMMTRQCAAGSNLFMILDALGNIVPCSFIEKKYDLYQPGFETANDFNKTINKMDQVFNFIQENGLSGECKNCLFVHSCKGGCIANKLSLGLQVTDEQPICYRKIMHRVLNQFTDKQKEKLINYWTYHFMQKCIGADKNKVCFRRLPIWEFNYRYELGSRLREEFFL